MKPLELWLPPDGAGAAIGCIATTFTFDADFFSRDCLARFLGLTAAYGEGDRASDFSLMIEEEERLAEATVTVLVDRGGYNAQARNLRWDLLPVAVPGGLLHAKSAVLLWEHSLRFIIGSANLTPAGYRRQVEMVSGYDIGPASTDLPLPIAEALLEEISRIAIDLVPIQMSGPRRRLLHTLDLARQRIRQADLTPSVPVGARFAVAAVRDRLSALDGFDAVWKGSKPRSCRALSPFWDEAPGNSSTNGVAAAVSLLSPNARDGKRPTLDLLVTVDVAEGGRIIRAPEAIIETVPSEIAVQALLFSPDEDHRRLHAKWLEYSNDEWIAVMFGSSNITAKGLGLARQSHRELNLWIGAKRSSHLGRQLAKTVANEGAINLEDWTFSQAEDEDEEETRPLPLGFVAATLAGSSPDVKLEIHLEVGHLPSEWSISLPDGENPLLVEATNWSGAPVTEVPLGGRSGAPTILLVRWVASDHVRYTASWVVNVDDASLLPPPEGLRELPVDALLAILASTRPLRLAVETESRRRENRGDSDHEGELDPLKKHASSTHLLPRVRKQSEALWGLRERLQRPMSSLEAMNWRLSGTMGPLYLARRLVEEATSSDKWLPGEAAFLLAELALTVRSTSWNVERPLLMSAVNEARSECIKEIRVLAEGLVKQSKDPQLARYLKFAFAEATK